MAVRKIGELVAHLPDRQLRWVVSPVFPNGVQSIHRVAQWPQGERQLHGDAHNDHHHHDGRPDGDERILAVLRDRAPPEHVVVEPH